MIQVTVDFGFDLHSIGIPEAVFAQIQAGHPMVVQGQGFPVEGVLEQDLWAFNQGTAGAVHVSTDEGHDMFEGNPGDPEVAIGADREG